MQVSKEAMGAFIDAVYAIAVTILALEIPAELGDASTLRSFHELLPEYALSSAILFALWVHHRRTNALIGAHTRVTVWLSAVAMLAACLIPRATTLVFEYGGLHHDIHVSELTPEQLEARAGMVDTFTVAVILMVDLTLLLLSRLVPSTSDGGKQRRFKLLSSLLLLAALALASAVPGDDRYFAVAIPLALLFEDELLAVVHRFRSRSTPDAA